MLDKYNLAVAVTGGPRANLSDDGWQGIEYDVEVSYKGEVFYTTQYRIGIGHVNISRGSPATLTSDEAAMFHAWRSNPNANFTNKKLQLDVAVKLAKAQKVQPKAEDVIYSMLRDGDALDYRSFEDWAVSYGYDTDSRKAEKIYNTCLKVGLVFRNALGEKVLEELNEEFKDY